MSGHDKVDNYKDYTAFGWVISVANVPQGWKVQYEIPMDMSPTKAPRGQLITAGKLVGEVINRHLYPNIPPDKKVADRLPGMYTRELGTILKGEYLLQAVEPTSWICLDLYNNPQANMVFPNLEPLRLKAGEAVAIPADTKLFFGWGEADVVKADGTMTHLSAVQALTFSGASTFRATTDCYGFVFP
jgi:hypothetical protein